MNNKKEVITLSKKQRICFLVIMLILLGIAGIMHKVYRPYVYENHIYDYHIADSFSNFIAVPSIQFLVLSLTKYIKINLSTQIIAICLSLVFYECFIGLTFDVHDIAATILSGVITYSFERLFLFSRISKNG